MRWGTHCHLSKLQSSWIKPKCYKGCCNCNGEKPTILCSPCLCISINSSEEESTKRPFNLNNEVNWILHLHSSISRENSKCHNPVVSSGVNNLNLMMIVYKPMQLVAFLTEAKWIAAQEEWATEEWATAWSTFLTPCHLWQDHLEDLTLCWCSLHLFLTTQNDLLLSIHKNEWRSLVSGWRSIVISLFWWQDSNLFRV